MNSAETDDIIPTQKKSKIFFIGYLYFFWKKYQNHLGQKNSGCFHLNFLFSKNLKPTRFAIQGKSPYPKNLVCLVGENIIVN